MKIVHALFPTPFGWCGLVKAGAGLVRIFLPEPQREALNRMIRKHYPSSAPAEGFFKQEIKELKKYFDGKNPAFSAALDFSGSTAFQRKVWEEAKKIPYGTVCTYGRLAEATGNPDAARAVGAALGKNPFPLIIPCHRVVRKNGGPGGFSATRGIKLKAELLRLEGMSIGDV